MLIEFFKPSKKNLLTLYLLRMFYWVPGMIGTIFYSNYITRNNYIIWLAAAPTIELLIAYIYSKRARPELQNYYTELLRIFWRYIKGMAVGSILYAITYTIYRVCTSSYSQIEIYGHLLITGIYGMYVVYLAGRYYIQMIRGFLSVWRAPQSELSVGGGTFSHN